MKNNALDDNFWLNNLPASYADYLSYTDIELGRHPSAFLVYQDTQKFIKQVPEHIQKVEYSILSWLEELQQERPIELELPKPDKLTSRSDLLITSKLDGVELTKLALLSRFPLLCKILAYLHQLTEVTQLPTIITQSVDHPLPINCRDIEACHVELFNHAKASIEGNIELLGLVHGDLCSGNILVTDSSIGIIDWEYANVRDCRWDLATIAVEFELNSDEFDSLCRIYLAHRELQDNNFTEVAKSWTVVYAVTCLSWAKKNNQSTNRYLQFLTNLY